MELHLYDNAVQFRLTRKEIARLALGETVCDMLQLGAARRFIFGVTPTTVRESVWAEFDEGAITVSVPQEMVTRWAATDDQAAIRADQTVSAYGDSLSIVLEKQPDSQES